MRTHRKLTSHDEDRRTAEEIIPVIEEHVVIGTERATTGTVRVRTVTHEEEYRIDEPVRISRCTMISSRWTEMMRVSPSILSATGSSVHRSTGTRFTSTSR